MATGCASDPNIEGAKLDLRNQDYDRALENVETALQNDPENSEAHMLKAQILTQLAADENDPEAHRALVEDLLASYERAVELDPGLEDDVNQQLRLAYYNEFSAGIEAFNRASNDPEEFNAAASLFGLAARIQPDSAGAHVNQAFALLNAGRQEEAVAPLEMAIEKGDRQKNTYLFLGDLYMRAGEEDKALDLFRDAADEFPSDPDVQAQLLNAYVQTGREEAAMEEYRAAVEADPDNPLLLYNLGSLLLEAEEYEEAVEFLARATEADPQYANAQYNLGAAYVNQAVELNEQVGDLDDALREERNNLSDSELQQRQSEIESLAEERRQMFAQSVPPLETAKELMEASGDDATGVCQALFSAYVQTDRQAEAEAIAECAGYSEDDN